MRVSFLGGIDVCSPLIGYFRSALATAVYDVVRVFHNAPSQRLIARGYSCSPAAKTPERGRGRKSPSGGRQGGGGGEPRRKNVPPPELAVKLRRPQALSTPLNL